jgi:hypothetical protein
MSAPLRYGGLPRFRAYGALVGLINGVRLLKLLKAVLPNSGEWQQIIVIT